MIYCDPLVFFHKRVGLPEKNLAQELEENHNRKLKQMITRYIRWFLLFMLNADSRASQIPKRQRITNQRLGFHRAPALCYKALAGDINTQHVQRTINSFLSSHLQIPTKTKSYLTRVRRLHHLSSPPWSSANTILMYTGFLSWSLNQSRGNDSSFCLYGLYSWPGLLIKLCPDKVDLRNTRGKVWVTMATQKSRL